MICCALPGAAFMNNNNHELARRLRARHVDRHADDEGALPQTATREQSDGDAPTTRRRDVASVFMEELSKGLLSQQEGMLASCQFLSDTTAMPSRKKAAPQLATPLTAPDRIQHLHNLAHDLYVATRDAHAASKNAREQFASAAEGVSDPEAPPGHRARR